MQNNDALQTVDFPVLKTIDWYFLQIILSENQNKNNFSLNENKFYMIQKL